jgi:uncharacterized protein (TIGR01777 family)
VVRWDGQNDGDWSGEFDGADVVINLAGRSVNCRYSPANRKEIMDSRTLSTRAVGAAIARARRPPALWLQAGTATIYSHRYDSANDEATGIPGGNEPDVPETWRFSTDVARAWEAEALQAQTPRTRKVLLRSAMTMSPDSGGVFDVLMKLVRRGLGGRAGDGKQYVSWIHETDFVGAVRWLIEHREVEGPVNLSAPGALPNEQFMRDLREAAGVKTGLPASKWMLELGAVFMRTETELVLKSRRVWPGKLLSAGFSFAFPDWNAAARDLATKWDASRSRG